MLAAARDLTVALAETAPRGCAASLLLASNTEAPEIAHPKARVETMSLISGMIPMLWSSGTAARPLDGEFVHSLSPIVPARTRPEDDGSQVTVTVPHTLAWDAPETLPGNQARIIRKFTRRALKHADVLITTTHAVAERLREIYGSAIDVQVIPLAAPREYLAGDDAAKRREEFGLPEEYLVTNTFSGDVGRLNWVLRAMEADESIPNLVLVGAATQANLDDWPTLKGRVARLPSHDLADLGAVIAGATAMVMPQQSGDCILPVYSALSSRVPIVHAGAKCIEETVLDAAVTGGTEEEFATALTDLLGDADAQERLRVLAGDRARMFSWSTAAWQLWEIHANL